MKLVYGNLWDWFDKGFAIAITTNGFVKNNGECVMGRGCALEAKKRFPSIATKLGSIITSNGNNVNLIMNRIYSFPVKHNWWEEADLDLIRRSCKELTDLTSGEVIIPRPGCGNGKLSWNIVKPILETELSDRFSIITFGSEPSKASC